MSVGRLFTSQRIQFGTGQDTSPGRAVADAAVLMALTAVASLVVPEAFRVFLTGLGYRDEIGIFVVAGSVATLSFGILAVVYLRRIYQGYLLAGANPLSRAVLVALTTIALNAVLPGAIYERTANLAVVVIAHGLTAAIIFAILLVLVL